MKCYCCEKEIESEENASLLHIYTRKGPMHIISQAQVPPLHRSKIEMHDVAIFLCEKCADA